ncbi:MAG: hypothetical protein Q9188_005527 [Gyalolechia gomerana]
MDDRKPDLIVGVDFGMTATGTRGSFNPANPGNFAMTNDSISQNAPDKDYKDWFKTFLDPARLRQKQAEDPHYSPSSIKEVERWYEDYHRSLYKHIEFKLSSELSGAPWHSASVEFIFSVPTTWSPQVVDKYRSIVQRSGFASCRNHTLTIGLTEAEAAAVHTSLEASGIFKEKDTLLVCDAGGGTTDLSVLSVSDTQTNALTLRQLDVVFGATIGSAAIDYDFESYARSQLDIAQLSSPLPMPPEQIAWEMMKSKDFQNTKCEHGSLDNAPIFSVPIPKLDPAYTNLTVGIEYGEMKFAREDLQRLFDKQVQKLVGLIDSQLRSMQRKLPDQQVNHLILAGGLGHSPYVQNQLRTRFQNGGGHPNAAKIQVRVAPDPQLAVCKGLVGDRLRRFKAGKPVLNSRCCRASYGMLCKEVYNKNNPLQAGRPTAKDPMNGKLYVVGSIDWFIKKGKPITSDEPITHGFHRKISPGDPRRAFPTSIVESHADEPFLPHHMGGGGVHILCEIESDLSNADESKFKEKNKRFWSLGKHYFKVDYDVKVLIGPADVRFELWFNGQKLSRDRPIKVEWTQATATELPAEEVVEIVELEEGGALTKTPIAEVGNGMVGGRDVGLKGG